MVENDICPEIIRHIPRLHYSQICSINLVNENPQTLHDPSQRNPWKRYTPSLSCPLTWIWGHWILHWSTSYLQCLSFGAGGWSVQPTVLKNDSVEHSPTYLGVRPTQELDDYNLQKATILDTWQIYDNFWFKYNFKLLITSNVAYDVSYIFSPLDSTF